MKTSTLLAIALTLSPTLALCQQLGGQAPIPVTVTPVTVTPVTVTSATVTPAKVIIEQVEISPLQSGLPPVAPPPPEPPTPVVKVKSGKSAITLTPAVKSKPLADANPPKAEVVPEPEELPAKDTGTPTSKTDSSISLHFDLDKQMGTWTGNGTTRTFAIASGKPGTETPTGNLYVFQKFGKDHESTQFKGAKMPYMLHLGGTDDNGRDVTSRGIGSHGTPIGFGLKNGTGAQYPASHGCIRMTKENAEWLFIHTPKKTPVTITGSAKTYLATNRVMPWQRPGAEKALRQLPDGEWAFIKPMTEDGARWLIAEIEAGRLGLCKLPETTPDKCPANFPDIPELGDPKKQTLAQRQERYFTGYELKEGLYRLANYEVKRYVCP